MRLKGGVAFGNKPDGIADAVAIQPANNIGTLELDSCGLTDGLCPGSCANSPSCTKCSICAQYTRQAWGALVKACTKLKHACYKGGSHGRSGVMQAKVSVKDCNVSNKPGPYGKTCDISGAIPCTNSTTIIGHCAINGNRAMMSKPGLCRMNAGSYIVYSNVRLNDTQTEGIEALHVAAVAIFDSKLKTNSCGIKRDRARSIFYTGECKCRRLFGHLHQQHV